MSRLVKEQATEADREGPGRPLQISNIGIADGLIEIDDRTVVDAQAPRLPRRVARLDFKGAFSYQPVNFTLTVGHLSFQGEQPALALNSLSGAVSVRGDDVYFEKVAVRTTDSSVQLKGMVRNYLGTPDTNLTLTSDRLTVGEFGGVVPQLASVDLHPAFELAVSGPMTALRSDIDVRSEAGATEGEDHIRPVGAGTFDQRRAAGGRPRRIAGGRNPAGDARQWARDVRCGVERRPDDPRDDRLTLENTTAAGYRVDRLDAKVQLAGSPCDARRQRDAPTAHTRRRKGTVRSADRRPEDAVLRPERPSRSYQRRSPAPLNRRAAHQQRRQRPLPRSR